MKRILFLCMCSSLIIFFHCDEFEYLEEALDPLAETPVCCSTYPVIPDGEEYATYEWTTALQCRVPKGLCGVGKKIVGKEFCPPLGKVCCKITPCMPAEEGDNSFYEWTTPMECHVPPYIIGGGTRVKVERSYCMDED